MSNIEVMKIKQMRKRILDNLNIMYPTGMRLDSLFRTVIPFDQTYDANLFKKDMTYLKEKNYICYVDEALGGFANFMSKVAKLTVDGKEVAEGTDTDKALEF